ncbi:hypothetical protein LV779_15925 [Streptomyces thinghirensis]|nr:hypothetical protein [Streptomyces thinghirensis]
MHGLGAYDGDRVAECLALACFAAAEADWRDLHSHVASIDDRELSKALHGAEAAVRAASRTLLASTVQTHARAGRRRILDLLRARDSDRSDWPDIRERSSAGPLDTVVPTFGTAPHALLQTRNGWWLFR